MMTRHGTTRRQGGAHHGRSRRDRAGRCRAVRGRGRARGPCRRRRGRREGRRRRDPRRRRGGGVRCRRRLGCRAGRGDGPIRARHLRRPPRPLQQRRHLAGRRRRHPRDTRGDVGARHGGEPQGRLARLQVRDSGAARLGRRVDRQRVIARGAHGIGRTADRVHREQGRRSGDDARAGGRVRAPRDPRQRPVPGTDRNAAHGRADGRPRVGGAPAGPHPDGTTRAGVGDRACRAVPGLRRFVVHDRHDARRRRGHHRGVRDTRIGEGATMSSGLGIDALREHIGSGNVDTVLVAFPDLQGRLMGKRVTGHYFLDHVEGEGIEACNYLLAVDVEMTPVPGYRFASWERGYGDMKAVPDLATLRPVPWLEKTALVLCDLVDDDTGSPVEVSPRRVLQRQIERAAAAGYTVKCGSELEFFLFRDSYEEAEAKGYAGLEPHSPVIEDYHVLQTTRDEYLIREIRNAMDASGVPVEFSKGEAGSTRSTSSTPTPSRWRTGTSSTRTVRRRSPRSRGGRSRSWRSTPWTRSARRATCTQASGTPTARG